MKNWAQSISCSVALEACCLVYYLLMYVYKLKTILEYLALQLDFPLLDNEWIFTATGPLLDRGSNSGQCLRA